MKSIRTLFVAVCLSSMAAAFTYGQTDPDYAVRFTGSDRHMVIPSALWFAGDFTVEAWVNPRSFNSNARILDFGNGPNGDNIYLSYTDGTSGYPKAGVYNGATAQTLVSPYRPPLNNWYHIALTLKSSLLTMYIDGQSVATTNLTLPVNSVMRTNNLIADSNWGSHGDSSVWLDEVRIWFDDRHQTAIESNMTRSLTGNEASLIGYWRFDEGSGSVVDDITGGGWTGTLYNAPVWSSSIPPFCPTSVTMNATGQSATAFFADSVIHSGGQSAFAWFEYGLTTAYGSSTVPQAIPAGNASQPFSQHITGLTNSQTYQFRVVVSNDCGVSYGKNKSRATLTGTSPKLIKLWPSSGTLFPAFNLNVTNYSLSTAESTFFLTPTLRDADASMYYQYNGSGFTEIDNVVPTPETLLSGGTNQFQIQGISYDGVWERTYTVLVSPLFPPSVTAQPPVQVGVDEVVLQAEANPIGSSTVAGFEWGRGMLLDQETVKTSIGSGNQPVAFSNSLPGLVPGLVYNARAAASNKWGISRTVSERFWLPDLQVAGANPFVVECAGAYTEPGAAVSAGLADLYAGANHTVALQADGTVLAWGRNHLGQTSVPGSAVNRLAVAAGESFTVVLKSNGKVQDWGSNFYGETVAPGSATSLTAIAAGQYHVLGLRRDGSVVAWGRNNFGQTDVPNELDDVQAVAAGREFSMALQQDGTVIAWGINTSGQTNVPALAPAVGIAAGASHALAVLGDRSLAAWGDNGNGQTDIPNGVTGVVAAAAGRSHSLALLSDGTVMAWGDNALGQTNVPPEATNVVGIAAGDYFCLALKQNGEVLGWGINNFGQITIPGGLSNLDDPVAEDGVVDTSSPGSYLVTYSVTNQFGFEASAVRTVVVEDTTGPSVNLIGSPVETQLLLSVYSERGVTSLDACDGLPYGIVTTITVNTSIPGDYTNLYTSVDAAGNTGMTTRLVKVVDLPVLIGLDTEVVGTNGVTGTRTVDFSLTIVPNGLNTDAYAEYGTTMSYGGTLGPAGIGNDYGSQVQVFQLSGLSAGQVYHWMGGASNSAGAVMSTDLMFVIPSGLESGDVNGDGLVSNAELDLVLSNYYPVSGWLDITNASVLDATTRAFQLPPPSAESFTVQYTTDMVTWISFTNSTPSQVFEDEAGGPGRTYRLQWP